MNNLNIFKKIVVEYLKIFPEFLHDFPVVCFAKFMSFFKRNCFIFCPMILKMNHKETYVLIDYEGAMKTIQNQTKRVLEDFLKSHNNKRLTVSFPGKNL